MEICAGTYAENVDLSQMASAGDITLRASGAVTIAPASGSAINTTAEFPGSITLDNINATSNDSDGISLGINGNILESDLKIAMASRYFLVRL